MKTTALLPIVSAALVAFALLVPPPMALPAVVTCIALSVVVIASWLRGFQSDADLWRSPRKPRKWRQGWWRRTGVG
jgi:hypothetical protein